MAYRISELTRFTKYYSVGEIVMVSHTEVHENATSVKREFCEILGIYKHHVLLKTCSRDKFQYKFSMTLFDFYNGVEPKRYTLINHEKDSLTDLIIDPKQVYYGIDYSGFNKHSEGIIGPKRAPLPIVFN